MRFGMAFGLFCTIGLVGFAGFAQTPFHEHVTCYKHMNRGREWNDCITKTEGSTNPNVLFEFHGLGENVHSWITSKRDFLIRQAWHTQHLQAPTVVSVSFGSIWLLAQKNSSPRSGLFGYFRDVVYPSILKSLGPIHGQKILLGASMGGFNASQIYLKLPHYFNRYVLICPIIANVSPFSPAAKIQQYITQNNANPFRVYMMMDIAKNYFPTAQSYNTAYPLFLAKKYLNASYPPIYLSCSHEDPYGIFNGVKEFAKLAQRRGVDVEWRGTHGPHCTIDDSEVARVLAVGQNR